MSMELNKEEADVVRKVLASHAVQMLIGAEEWNLTEQEEELLWEIIRREKLL